MWSHGEPASARNSRLLGAPADISTMSPVCSVGSTSASSRRLRAGARQRRHSQKGSQHLPSRTTGMANTLSQHPMVRWRSCSGRMRICCIPIMETESVRIALKRRGRVLELLVLPLTKLRGVPFPPQVVLSSSPLREETDPRAEIESRAVRSYSMSSANIAAVAVSIAAVPAPVQYGRAQTKKLEKPML
jgi:hypothetical protein